MLKQRNQFSSLRLIFWIGLVLLISLAYYFYVWLVKPESSLTAQLQKYSNEKACFSCHQINGEVKPKKHLPASHELKYTKEDWQFYFDLLTLDYSAREGNYNQNTLYQGEMLARQYNCFLCHGKFGQGGVTNLGGLKGYIPGWFGSDFKHLTQNNDKDKILEWINTGMNQDLLELPILGQYAKEIFENQQLKMIELNYIPEHEKQLLTHYVAYLHELGELTPQKIQTYREEVREMKQGQLKPISVNLAHD